MKKRRVSEKRFETKLANLLDRMKGYAGHACGPKPAK